MTAVEWSGLPPPPRKKSVTKWSRIAADLRTRPGQWAVVDRCTTGVQSAMTAGHIRLGILRDMPVGEFESAARRVDGEYRVYARYVGAS